MAFHFDVDKIRADFPACSRTINGAPIAYLDGPAGSQIPQCVIDRMVKCMVEQTANEDGNFDPGFYARGLEDETRAAAADLLGCDADEVGFSCSSTQNSFNLAMSYSKQLQPGDELIVTQIDHRCNTASWNSLSRIGCVVKWVRLDPVTMQLDFEDFKSKLSPRTKVVAINWASNALGTVTDVKKYVDLAHEVGAITIVDAVHYAAHFPIDVKAIGTDVLLCSAYKWFGPHIGVMYMRKELIASIDFNNVKCDDIAEGARRMHMGTPQYEYLTGVTAAINYIASIGEQYMADFEQEIAGLSGRRKNIVAGMLAIDAYEQTLATRLRHDLRKIPGVKVYGPAEGQPRTPTVVFTVAGHTPAEVTKILGQRAINAWDGDYYAVEVIDALGLRESGGMVRVGMAPYCTSSDIDRLIYAVRAIAEGDL